MLIITSSIPLRFWYRDLMYNHREDLAQLYRRISCYVTLTQEEIFVYDKGLDEIGNPIGLPYVYKNDCSSKQRNVKEAFDFASAFNKISTPFFPENF